MSNGLVGRLRSLCNFLSAFLLSLCAVLFLTLLACQVEQHVFRRRAELLLSQVQSLELRKTPWQEAQVRLQRWGQNREFGDHCDAHKCSLQITLKEFVFDYFTQRNLFVKLDDYFRWRLKLSYNVGPLERMEYSLLQAYLRLGGHPARIIASIGMRDGIVWSKGFYVGLETYGHPVFWSGNWRIEFTLIATASSVSRLDRSFAGLPDPQLMLHPYYSIGRPSGCTICVEGWAIFTPYAEPADVHRLLQFDLSCLTRWHQCLTQSDIIPVAWNQYLAERPIVEGSRGELAFSPCLLEILGRDSENIAVVEILKHRDKVDQAGSNVATVRLLSRLKGVADWNTGEPREVHIWRGKDDTLKLPAGNRVILFRGRLDRGETWISSLSTSPMIPVSETNLSLIRRGIDEDYNLLD